MDAFAALERAIDVNGVRPLLAADVRIVRFRSRVSGSHAVLHQPRSDRYHRLTGPQADLAAGLDGCHTVAELSGAARDLRPADVVDLVEFLRVTGCLAQPSTDVHRLLQDRVCGPPGRARRVGEWLRAPTIQVPGVPVLTEVVYRHGGRWLFTTPAAGVLLCLAVACPVLLLAQADRLSVLERPTTAEASALWALALSAVVAHELGHALAVRHAGRRIRGAGFGLYLGNPVFFIDSSDMVLAAPRERAVNAAAGPLADLALAGGAAIVATAAGPTPLGQLAYRFAVLTFVFAAINLFPLLELDGYWLLTDLLDVPDLRPRAWAFLRRDLSRRLRSRQRLTRGERGLVAFALGGVAATVAAIVAAVVFWWPILSTLGQALWHSGWLGRGALLLLGALAAGPLAMAVAAGVRRVYRWASRQHRAVLFRLQQRWRVEAAELVADLPATVPLTDAQLGDLAGRITKRRFAAGALLLRQGDPGTALLVVRRGRCDAFRDDGTGEQLRARLLRGAIAGDHPLRDGGLEPMTVRAETAGEVFLVDPATYRRLLAPAILPSAAPTDWPAIRVRTVHPLRDLDPATAAAVAAAGRWVDGAPGTDLVDVAAAWPVLLLVRGQVEIRSEACTVTVLRAGQVLPAPADGPDSRFGLRALTPVELFAVPQAAVPLMPPAAMSQVPPVSVRTTPATQGIR